MKTIKGKVVLFDTKDRTNILQHIYGLEYYENPIKSSFNTINKHLYITSDEDIEECDWIITENSKDICMVGTNYGRLENAKKVIATTDESLNLPLIPQSFIENYIKEYNKGNVIENIEIEIEPINQPEAFKIKSNINYKGNFKSKINSNNEISIKSIKDSWTREEVEALLYKHGVYTFRFAGIQGIYDDKLTDNFIKENL